MNLKGKKVKVSFYEYFAKKPFKEVIGKVLSIHTSQSIRDTNTITILDDKGKEHSGGYMNSFVVKEL